MTILLRDEQRAAVAWGLRTLERCGGVLFADEPGFGKSFQALAVARALKVSPTVIAPRALHPMWEDYLSRFRMDGKLYSYGELLHDRRLSTLLHDTPTELLIVDEAHSFVNPSTARYRALSKLSFGVPTILLSATPFQNRLEDGLHLLALFSGEARWLLANPSEREAGLTRLMAQLGLKRHRQTLRPAERMRFPVETSLGPLRALASALCLQGEPYGLILHHLLSRRLSSQRAWLATLRRAEDYLEESEDAWLNGRRLDRALFRREFGEGQRAFHFLLPELRNDLPKLELALLQEAKATVAAAYTSSAQTTPNPNWDWLLSLPRPLVVFSQYRATINELYYRFRSKARVVRWTGGGINSNFPRPSGPVDRSLSNAILLATDVAAEGIDLRVCSSLVHADLHWNPMQTIQREGRVLRGSAQAPALIFTPRYPTEILEHWPIESRRQSKLQIAARFQAPSEPARTSDDISTTGGAFPIEATEPQLFDRGAHVTSENLASPRTIDANDLAASAYLRRHLRAWQQATRTPSLRAWLSVFEAASLLPVGASYWLAADLPHTVQSAAIRATRLQRVQSHLSPALEATTTTPCLD